MCTQRLCQPIPLYVQLLRTGSRVSDRGVTLATERTRDRLTVNQRTDRGSQLRTDERAQDVDETRRDEGRQGLGDLKTKHHSEKHQTALKKNS